MQPVFLAASFEMPSLDACHQCSFAAANTGAISISHCSSWWDSPPLLTPARTPLAAYRSLAGKQSPGRGPVLERSIAQGGSLSSSTFSHYSGLSFTCHPRCRPRLKDSIQQPRLCRKSNTAVVVKSSGEKLGDGVFIERASDSNLGAGSLEGRLTTTRKSLPKQKGGKVPEKKEAVQTYVVSQHVWHKLQLCLLQRPC